VALKRFKQRTRTPESYAAIASEITLHKRLASPHIVRLLDSFENEKKDFFVVFDLMESDLGNVLAGFEGPLPLPIRKAYLHQILLAIQYCHSLGVVHRVSPLPTIGSPSLFLL
jgi:serine/threonine protein kinase